MNEINCVEIAPITYSNTAEIAKLNDFELDALMQQTTNERLHRLAEKMNEVITVQSKQNRDLITQSKIIKETEEKANKTAELIDVIGFGIHSKKGKILRSVCSSRVHNILGEMSGCNYLLWNSYFFKKIYSDLGDHFNVDSYKNIHVNDFEQAKAFASCWRPSDTYVYEKTQEMIEKRDKGLLVQNRCMALYMYLEETDGGKINLF